MNIQNQIIRSLIWHISRRAVSGMTPWVATVILIILFIIGSSK